MESLKQIRLLVCASRGGWHRRTPAEVAALWQSASHAEKTAMRERLAKLKADQREALEVRLASVEDWGVVDIENIDDEEPVNDEEPVE